MILDTIAASTLERVAAAKEALPLAEQIARARDLDSNTGCLLYTSPSPRD